tara:strand:+ start:207 stop:851 length:645 start_codon:yes stop_codon:yes gene_type:complete
MLKDCPSDKIVNPLTNRCVKRDGKIGKQIMDNEFDGNTEKMLKNCPSDKILNPLTNRCVKKDGKIGKQITGKTKIHKTKIHKTKIHNKYVYVDYNNKTHKIQINKKGRTTIKEIRPSIVKLIPNKDIPFDISTSSHLVFYDPPYMLTDIEEVDNGDNIKVILTSTKCKHNKIVDPLNGKCVTKDGEKHRLLIQNNILSKSNFVYYTKQRLSGLS